MHILNFPFFFSINNTKYPTDDCDSQIYPFLRFSLTNSLFPLTCRLERTLVLF